MRFQVPQNLDVPDTIFFNLTFKQFMFLGGGIGTFVALILFTNLFIAILIGGPVTFLGVAFAFFKKDHLSFPDLLNVMLKYSISKKMYTWKKDTSKQVLSIDKVDGKKENTTKVSSGVGNKIREKSALLGFEKDSGDEYEDLDVNI